MGADLRGALTNHDGLRNPVLDGQTIGVPEHLRKAQKAGRESCRVAAKALDRRSRRTEGCRRGAPRSPRSHSPGPGPPRTRTASPYHIARAVRRLDPLGESGIIARRRGANEQFSIELVEVHVHLRVRDADAGLIEAVLHSLRQPVLNGPVIVGAGPHADGPVNR